MALCCLLAFWTGRDSQRVDELFRRSGLLRAKWDEVHYADGSTYGEKTVERACQRTTEAYQSKQSP
jgi:primase-polymerase (primpol)-like protein